jgi:segregation and condensation protein B
MSEARLVPVGPGPVHEPGASPEDDRRADEDGRPADEGRPPDIASREEPVRGASVADIEALLFVAERPLARSELRSLTGLSSDEIDASLGDLEVQLRDRGIRLVTSGEQVTLATAPESGRLIARYLGADAVRLSPAALETLAIVAYRQPVTRGTIERIRGVDSGHVLRSLLHRRLVQEQGRADSPGRPILYVTSMGFMERFGLTSLDDLPPIEAEVAARLADAAVDAGPPSDEEAVARLADAAVDAGPPSDEEDALLSDEGRTPSLDVDAASSLDVDAARSSDVRGAPPSDDA